MALAFRSFSNTSYTYVGSTTITKPAGVAENDIMIASFIMFRSGTPPTAPVAPSGWTQIGSYVADGPLTAGLYRLHGIWWKRATASEPADYLWDQWEGNSTQATIQAWTGGILSGNPVDVFSQNIGTGSTATGTGITTTVANTALLFITQNFDASGTLTPPTGMTERFDNLSYLSDQAIAAAGATGNRTQTQASGAQWSVFMVAIKPEPAGGTPVSVNVTGDAMTSSVGTASATTTGGVSVSVTGNPITASLGDAVAGGQTSVTVNVTGPFQKTLYVGDVTVTTAYIVAGPQFAVADSFGGSFIIDQQARDFGALGTYFAKPSASPNTYAIVSGDAMTASTATSSVTAAQRISVTGSEMTLATNPVTVTVPLAAPVFRAVSNTNYQDRAGLTNIIKPDTQANDIILAAVFMGANPDPGDATPPAGFTAIAASTSVSASGFVGRFQVFWKRAGESEPTSYDFEHPGVTASTQVVMEAFSGCSVLSSPIVAVSTASGTGTTSTATAITTAVPNSGLVFAGHCWAGAGATPPTGFEERFDFVVTISDDDKPTAGSTGSIVSTPNGNSGGSDPWQAWLIGLKPVAAIGGGDVYVEVGGTQMAALTADPTVLAGVTYPPAFRSISSVSYASRTNTTIAKPVGAIERDVILAAMFWGTTGDPGDGAITAPTGWQSLGTSTRVNFSSFNGRFRVYYKLLTASEPDTYTFTHNVLTTQIVAMAYAGAMDTGNPVQAMSTALGNAQTSTATSITTSDNNETLVVFGHNWTAGGLGQPPAGWTERFDNLVTASEQPFLTAGATGDVTYVNGNDNAAYPWQSWLLALKPSGTGDVSIEATMPAMTAYAGNVVVEYDSVVNATGTPMTMSLGIANVRINGGMRIDVTCPPMAADVGSVGTDTGEIYIAQKAKGVSNTATTMVSFSAVPRAGHLIFLGAASNDYNLTPDTGWIQAAGMEQQTYHGAYGWYRIADGVTNGWPFTIQSAAGVAWVLVDFANVDNMVPYDISAGDIGQLATHEHATPAIVPSAGNRLTLAILTGSVNADLSAVTVLGWTNGFVSIDNSGTGYPGTNDFIGMAYNIQSVNGATSISTFGTFSSFTTMHKQCGLIIAFKKAVTYAPITGTPMTASVGSVSVRTSQNIPVTATTMEALAGGFSVTDSVGVNIVLGSVTMAVETGSALVPMYSGWDVATIAGAARLTNGDKTLTQSALTASTAMSCIEHDDGKHYVEVTLGGSNPTGYLGLYDPVTNNGTRIVLETGQILKSPANTLGPMFSPIVAGDVIGIAYNGESGEVFYRVNGGLWNNDEDQHPGGFDWPAAHNTGYQNAPGYPGFLTPYTGGDNNIIRQPNQRFEFMYFEGLTVLKPGCEFYGCYIASNWTIGWAAKTAFDEGEGSTTFQFCTIAPLPQFSIPNPAWPSAGAGVDTDGVDEVGYTPYMLPYLQSYQYGLIGQTGDLIIEDCDIWGYANAITLYGTTTQKNIIRCWIHDAANPYTNVEGPGTGSHTDGPGHLDNSGCWRVTIRDCTIASLGNTNAIAFQSGREVGYKDIIVRHNFLSGFGYCVAMGSLTDPEMNNLQWVNNIFATDISWWAGPVYPNNYGPIFSKPGNAWSGNVLQVLPGTVARPNSHPKWVPADDGKYVWPDTSGYKAVDFQPSNTLRQDPAIYYPVYASLTNNTIAATATINTGTDAFAAEQPEDFGDWASPNTYVEVSGVSMQVVQGGFSIATGDPPSITIKLGSGTPLTAAIGEESVTATTGAQCFVTGNSMTIEAGTVNIPFSQGVSVAVTGDAITASVGSVTQGVSVTGVEMAASVGTVGVPQPVFIMVTGNEMAASTGTITLKQGQAINVTGNLMALQMGAVFVSLPGQAGPSTDLREGRMLDMANWMGN